MEKSLDSIMTGSAQLTDLSRFFCALLLADKKLKCRILGRVNEQPIVLLTPRVTDHNKKSFLIAAGFHGDEIAGPLGLLKYIQADFEEDANVSFLPLVNPTGFASKTRMNYCGMSPNTGFIHEGELSEEGRILMDNIREITPLAKNGFLSLHEDKLNDNFYLYYFDSKHDTKIKSLLECGSKQFGLVEDGFYQYTQIKQGLVRNCHDGSFEDLLSHMGVELSVCTETPQLMDINLRTQTVVDLIKIFVKN